jgi:hypothetical protein
MLLGTPVGLILIWFEMKFFVWFSEIEICLEKTIDFYVLCKMSLNAWNGIFQYFRTKMNFRWYTIDTELIQNWHSYYDL